ncbi:helicase-related protein [Caenispirillum bisanense]|uniref:ATP-dependent RNA helicase SUPV3L1/SUV3 n=1 Tax=Caenispirillum bisanense TaxID=414052 RepID=A0A286GGV8_9PROT|nr:helicase-related protein [Caenispirillum bisanense]SOD94702.1 ATP-dependent RNA helicase SUPV3L1/SUV3 [Caenispirillum bisanense]
MNGTLPGARITAVLGPTNTGKTHLAIERMMGHATGMIGFPLRLLARENYDRIVRAKGPHRVALITGEEKIIPTHPSWWVCTVESMPLDRRVDFLAVDEIQLCADPDRGHIFTDRLLRARGMRETMFLGSETIKPLIRELVPGIEVVTRPRLSQLSYAGAKKLTRLPRRSAIVAFSAADVYAIAELVRRQRGGAAVVLGALSPRTRNAQVAMFQAGEVDQLVATDAIGMGLNMDVDHVAFASLRKFDGHMPRNLDSSEVAQIAGRAGRGMNDGTFGTTGDAGAVDPEIVERVEAHTFPALRGLFWRNADLRLSSIDALLASLGKPPPKPGLVRPRRPADDQLALEALARDPEIRKIADSAHRVRLLWDVCGVPDFRKVMPESHSRLLGQIYRHLTGKGQRIPTDWLAGHVAQVDRVDGDMHALVDRIASIRVWTYIAHRGDWLHDAREWQDKTRAVEDRLSDALHERLTQRFVDKRTAVLARALRDDTPLMPTVAAGGAVLVEGQSLGQLSGLRFIPEKGESRAADRTVMNAAGKALRREIAERVDLLAQDADDAFALDDAADVLWRGEPVARLTVGPDPLRPGIDVPFADMLEGDAREKVRRRVGDWVKAHVGRVLKPLVTALEADLAGAPRGLVFQLAEALGALPRAVVEPQIRALTDADRKALARLGVRFGVETVFLPALLKAAPQRLRGRLWAARTGGEMPQLPEGRTSLPFDAGVPAGYYEAIGYRVLGPVAVRVDMLERFAAELRRLAREKQAVLPPQTLTLLGVSVEEAPAVLQALGWQAEQTDDGLVVRPLPRRPARPDKAKTGPRKKTGKGKPGGGGGGGRKPGRRDVEDSPFAILRDRVRITA